MKNVKGRIRLKAFDHPFRSFKSPSLIRPPFKKVLYHHHDESQVIFQIPTCKFFIFYFKKLIF
jgi:hypothetical protein